MVLIKTKDWDDFKTEISFLIKHHMSLAKKQVPSPWLSEKEACKFLNVSKGTLRSYRLNKGLPYSKNGKQNFYKREDLNQFLHQNYNGHE